MFGAPGGIYEAWFTNLSGVYGPGLEFTVLYNIILVHINAYIC